MADSRGYSPRPSLGLELRAGQSHLDRYGKNPAPSASHRPVTGQKKSHLVSSHPSNHERARLLELPRIRALQNDAVEVPVSESSAASSVSSRSGSSRVHPCNPDGEVIEGSSFEVVPSVTNRAASASGHDESLEVTPIRRSNSSPVVLNYPIQVMSPNLVAGMASGSTQAPREQDIDPTTARAILQQWPEVKSEDGSVARTYSQCAKTWRLADQAAFDSINIEAAIQILRQACDYLHQGLTQVGTAIEQKD